MLPETSTGSWSFTGKTWTTTVWIHRGERGQCDRKPFYSDDRKVSVSVDLNQTRHKTHICLGEVGRLVAVRQREVEGVLELFLS